MPKPDEDLTLKSGLLLSMARVIHAIHKNPTDNFKFKCSNREFLHRISHSHPHIQSVNQTMDSRNIPLEKNLILHFIRTMDIDHHPCKTFVDRSIQSLKSIKNELKIAKEFKTAADRSRKGSEIESFNRVGYYSHFAFAVVQASLCSTVNLIEDMNSCGFGSGVALDHYISRKSKA
jgi:hypothetical protein